MVSRLLVESSHCGRYWSRRYSGEPSNRIQLEIAWKNLFFWKQMHQHSHHVYPTKSSFCLDHLVFCYESWSLGPLMLKHLRLTSFFLAIFHQFPSGSGWILRFVVCPLAAGNPDKAGQLMTCSVRVPKGAGVTWIIGVEGLQVEGLQVVEGLQFSICYSPPETQILSNNIWQDYISYN